MPKQYDEKKIDRSRERAMQVLLHVHSEAHTRMSLSSMRCAVRRWQSATAAF